MRYSLVVLIVGLFTVMGCGSGKIRPDVCDGTSQTGCPAASQANYPTAEFYACGKAFHGLGVCFVERGELLDTVAISIQGYNSGTIRIVSQDCFLDDDLRYEGNQRVRIGLPGVARESCLLSFVISPEHDSEETSGIVIRSFKGHLWISVKDKDDQTFGFTSKVAEDGDAEVAIPVASPGAHRIAFRGCGVSFDQSVDADGGFVRVTLKQLLPHLLIQRCVLQGGVEDASGPVFVSWMVWGYDKRFIPLPRPAISFDGDKLKVSADRNVSVISLDSGYKLDTSAEFKFDKTKFHTLRLLTVGGRSVLGFWSVQQGAFTWMQ